MNPLGFLTQPPGRVLAEGLGAAPPARPGRFPARLGRARLPGRRLPGRLGRADSSSRRLPDRRLVRRLLPGIPVRRPGVLTCPPGLLLGLVTGLLGLLLGLLVGLLGLLLGFVPGLAGLLAQVRGRVPAGPAGLAGGPGQLLAQAAHGLPDVLPDLAHDVADRGGQLLLELVELVAAAAQLLAAGLGDPVDLAAVHLVVRDQALFLQPGQPRVDRARGGRVDAHEPVTQQPDDLIAVPGLLIEQPEQVQPEASVAEYRTQLASPSISFSLSGSRRGPWSAGAFPRPARRSSIARPDMVVTDTLPEPAPRLPLTECDAGADNRLSSANSLRTSPDTECRFTWASASAGSLRVTSPDTVVTFMPPSGSRSMSAVTSPLTEFASRRSSQPSTRVRSPDTVLKLTLPLMPCASIAADTV